MNKAHEYRELPLEELESMVRERAEEIMYERIKVKMHQADNALRIRYMRRDLAAIKTVINEKKKAAQP